MLTEASIGLNCLWQTKFISRKKEFWPLGDFLVRYFHNVFLCH